ncbi:transmembrane protein 200A [Lates japonicus]|uniref:Transmembrane protein 200A n=1 Tax=Lates japonicus TaxID=270547 RepID=A0AAD3MRG6_LATJO|nr:transmembrane protein 200A [Lates japonicus]
MTAAAGVLTGLAKLKRQDSARSQHRPIPLSPGLGNPGPEAAPRKRKRRTDVVVVRGRLRLYSASGFFLLLGLVILAMGIGMADQLNQHWQLGIITNHCVATAS